MSMSEIYTGPRPVGKGTHGQYTTHKVYRFMTVPLLQRTVACLPEATASRSLCACLMIRGSDQVSGHKTEAGGSGTDTAHRNRGKHSLRGKYHTRSVI